MADPRMLFRFLFKVASISPTNSKQTAVTEVGNVRIA